MNYDSWNRYSPCAGWYLNNLAKAKGQGVIWYEIFIYLHFIQKGRNKLFWEEVKQEQYSVICGDFDYFYVAALKSN